MLQLASQSLTQLCKIIVTKLAELACDGNRACFHKTVTQTVINVRSENVPMVLVILELSTSKLRGCFCMVMCFLTCHEIMLEINFSETEKYAFQSLCA